MNKVFLLCLLFFQNCLYGYEQTFYELDSSVLKNIKEIEKIYEDGIQVDWVEALGPLDLRDGSAPSKLQIDYKSASVHYSSWHWVLGTSKIARNYGAKGFKREWRCGNSENVLANILIPASFLNGDKNELELLLHRAISVAVYNVIKRIFEEEERMNPNFPKKSVKLKWINDVMVNGKKICGIKPDDFMDFPAVSSYQFAVNVNMSQDELNEVDQPATSLAVECGHNFDCQKVTRAILIELIHIMNRYKYDLDGLDQIFSSKMCFIGEPVIVYDAEPGKDVSGVLESVSGGRLYIRGADKNLNIIYPGSGILRKLSQ